MLGSGPGYCVQQRLRMRAVRHEPLPRRRQPRTAFGRWSRTFARGNECRVYACRVRPQAGGEAAPAPSPAASGGGHPHTGCRPELRVRSRKKKKGPLRVGAHLAWHWRHCSACMWHVDVRVHSSKPAPPRESPPHARYTCHHTDTHTVTGATACVRTTQGNAGTWQGAAASKEGRMQTEAHSGYACALS